MKRLGQVIIGTDLQAFDLIIQRMPGGDDDDARLGMLLFQRLDHVQPTATGQGDVHQNTIVFVGARLEHGLIKGRGHLAQEAVLLQILLDRTGQRRFVFDDQDLHSAKLTNNFGGNWDLAAPKSGDFDEYQPDLASCFLKTFMETGNLINPDSVIFEQNTIDMQAESKLPLKGIHYLMDSDNNKVAVQIDLEIYGELWQEFLDRLIIEFRKDEESDSFDDFLKELEEEGLLDE